ncbi:MAG: nucleoside phosphorylase [Bacteroidales bacterium]|nr:nucleoside phosphorylase [Bacteroidales bacterium]
MADFFPASELLINDDGSVFHLHLRPDQLADKVILVGDPDRVSVVADHFESRECDVRNREFHAMTGCFRGKRISVISTGIGCDNIDIVLNELDALANIDFKTRQVKKQLRSLEIVRIGTCGGLQPDTPVGTFVCSAKFVGLDALLNFYQGRDKCCDTALEQALLKHLGWTGHTCSPLFYAVEADPELSTRIAGKEMLRGITVTANGFYGPQGRELRVPLADPFQNEKLRSFEYQGLRVTNLEMEGSAIAGLGRILGHRATTVCMVIANRFAKDANTDYRQSLDDLIRMALERI